MRMGMGDGIIIDDDDLLFLFFVFELLSYDLILWTVLSGEAGHQRPRVVITRLGLKLDSRCDRSTSNSDIRQA